jgi:hypothetical protein
MLDIKTVQPAMSFLMPLHVDNHRELDRLLAAAVVNQKFCRMLLENPELALQLSYPEETFLFSEEERNLLLSICADTLADFAGQLMLVIDQQTNVQINRPIQSSGLDGY